MKKILIVEDEFYICDIYERTFKDAGYEVQVAVDGQEALQKAKNTDFDVILLDIMVPKITGIDVLRELRQQGERTEDTPIFMTTNLGQDNIIKEALKIGADGYFIKAQLNPKSLVNEVNTFLQNEGNLQKGL